MIMAVSANLAQAQGVSDPSTEDGDGHKVPLLVLGTDTCWEEESQFEESLKLKNKQTNFKRERKKCGFSILRCLLSVKCTWLYYVKYIINKLGGGGTCP